MDLLFSIVKICYKIRINRKNKKFQLEKSNLINNSKNIFYSNKIIFNN